MVMFLMGERKRAPNWTETEKDILRDHINVEHYRDIAKMLPGRTVEAVKRRADLIGLPRRWPTGPEAKRTLDEMFFARNELLSAYWAGFIAADGCIVEHPRKEVRIGIHQKDINQLRRFAIDTNFDGKLSIRNNICYLTICSAGRWIHDLKTIYNIGPRKTFTLERPEIDGDMALAYSIGYIDGDGCWATHKGPRGNRKLVLIVVGTEGILTWLVSLWKGMGASIGGATIRKSRGCYRLSITGSHADSIAKLLQEVDVRKFERKWQVARREVSNQKGAPWED